MPRITLGTQSKGMLVACARYGGLLLVAAILQVTLLSRWRLFDCVPDLTLAAVFAIAFFCGAQIGAIAGIAGGFFVDALGSFGLSLLPVFYLFIGYVVGHYARAVYPKRLTSYATYAFFALLLRAAASVTLAAASYKSIALPAILLRSVLPEFGLTLVLALLLYAPMRAICSRWAKK
jgi:rod shape-determining protein MreD